MLAKLKAKLAAIREHLLGWKTVIWNVFLGVTPVVLVAIDKVASVDLSQYMSWWLAIIVGAVVSSIGVWLRFITTGPVGAKGDEAPDPDVKAGD